MGTNQILINFQFHICLNFDYFTELFFYHFLYFWVFFTIPDCRLFLFLFFYDMSKKIFILHTHSFLQFR